MAISHSLNARAFGEGGSGVGSGPISGTPSVRPYGLYIKHHGNLPSLNARARLGRGLGVGPGPLLIL